MTENEEDKNIIEDSFKLKKAMMLIKQKRVKKYIFKPSNIERWVVEGKRRKYLVIPNFFCQCENFYISVVIRKREKMCYHLLAQKIAEKNNEYIEVTLNDEEYDDFMEKFRETSS